jgi:cytochrome c553
MIQHDHCLQGLLMTPQTLTLKRKVIGICCVLGGMLLATNLWAGDAAAGKAVAQAKCAGCHQPADWKGETEASLQSLLRDVASGKVRHNKAKVELSDADIANVATYWLTTKK